jgi:hypothetical protein
MEVEVMANAIDHIDVFNRNAYILTPILEKFYEFTQSRERNILLSYLVFAIILSPNVRSKLINANKNSSIHTLFSDKTILAGIQERVNSYKNITNKCLLLAFQVNSFCMTNNKDITYITSNSDASRCSKEILRATKNLAILLDSYEIVDSYRMLGIKRI